MALPVPPKVRLPRRRFVGDFQVDRIVAKRVNLAGALEYRARWSGFGSDDDT